MLSDICQNTTKSYDCHCSQSGMNTVWQGNATLLPEHLASSVLNSVGACGESEGPSRLHTCCTGKGKARVHAEDLPHLNMDRCHRFSRAVGSSNGEAAEGLCCFVRFFL